MAQDRTDKKLNIWKDYNQARLEMGITTVSMCVFAASLYQVYVASTFDASDPANKGRHDTLEYISYGMLGLTGTMLFGGLYMLSTG